MESVKLTSIDFSRKPQLFGRWKEVHEIIKLYLQSKEGFSRHVFVAGPPGIGKSYVVERVKGIILDDYGLFLEGKYDINTPEKPFGALSDALGSYMRRIISHSCDEELEAYRKKIHENLGNRATLIADIIPDFDVIAGPFESVPDVPLRDSVKRLNRTLGEFIISLKPPGGVLTLFLDDLHWADNASISFLEYFLKREMKGVFIITAYRDIEMMSQLSGVQFISSAEESKGCHFFDLSPLDEGAVTEMICDVLHGDITGNQPFIQKVIEETKGNPLFVMEYLESLYHHNALGLSMSDGMLHVENYDSGRISAFLSRDLLDIITGRIEAFEGPVRELLKVASCLGTGFRLSELEEAAEASRDEMNIILETAVRHNILIEDENFCYRFIHDKVWEAVYALFEDDDVSDEVHYRIAKLLLDKAGKTGEVPPDICRRLNRAVPLLTSDERKSCVYYNNLEGKKFLDAGAFEEAFSSYDKAVSLLDSSSWQNDYALTLNAHKGFIEAGFLTDRYNESVEKFNKALKYIRDAVDKAVLYEMRIEYYSSTHQFSRAIDAGLNALSLLDFPFPAKVTKIKLLKEYALVKLRHLGRSVEDYKNIPFTDDKKITAILRILISFVDSGYVAYPEYMAYTILKMMGIVQKYGNTEYSPYVFVCFGVIDGSISGNLKRGYQFGQLAMELLGMEQTRRLEAKVNFIFGTFIQHWVVHYRRGIATLYRAFETGLEHGDYIYASYGINGYVNRLLYCCFPLDEVIDEFENNYGVVMSMGSDIQGQKYNFWYQFALTLKGKTENRTRISGVYSDEDSVRKDWEKTDNKNGLGMLTIYKMTLHLLYGEYKEACAAARQGEEYMENMVGMIFHAEYVFLYALAMMRYYDSADKNEQKEIRRKSKKYCKLIKKWSLLAPDNFEHRFLLIEGEKARLKGNKKQAVKYYIQGGIKAGENSFLYINAFACEFTAHIYEEERDEEKAAHYMKEAFRLYSQWGAGKKCQQLINDHRQYFPSNEKGPVSLTGFGVKNDSFIFEQGVDIKDSMGTSNGVIHEVFALLIKETGYDRIVPVVCRDSMFYLIDIPAAGGEESEKYTITLCNEKNSPLSTLRYCERTGQSVLVELSPDNRDLPEEKYIIEKNIPALCCMKLLDYDNCSVIIYGESKKGLIEKDLLPGLVNKVRGVLSLFFENLIVRFREDNCEFAVNGTTVKKSLEDILKDEFAFTPQEARIACMLRDGRARRIILSELSITSQTLKNHLRSMYGKTINKGEDSDAPAGRVDKLSQFIFFLFDLEER